MNEGQRWLHAEGRRQELQGAEAADQTWRGTADFEVREQPGCLGEHTDSILAELGYSAAEIEALKSERVVLRSDQMLNIEREGVECGNDRSATDKHR